jgi:hypothetical protein
VVWNGPFVQSDENSLVTSARMFQSIGQEAFWDHRIDDEEWRAHCAHLDLRKTIEEFPAE